jgi:hypothetical protein
VERLDIEIDIEISIHWITLGRRDRWKTDMEMLLSSRHSGFCLKAAAGCKAAFF